MLMTVATVAFGLLPTYATVGLLAPVLLLLCRTLQGLSASAEVTGAQLLILEHAPAGRRGRAVAVNNAAGHLASAAAATTGLLLARLLSPEQLAGWGWRLAFLAAAPIGLVGLYVRTRLVDSPAFLALGERAKQGRAPLTQALRTAKRGMLIVGVWTAVTTLGVYLLVGLLPSYLVQTAGLSRTDAFTTNLIAVLTLASSALIGGYLLDRYPLRRVAIVAMAGVAVMAVPGFLIITEGRSFSAALTGQIMWTMFLGATYTTGTMLAVTLFPVAVRFTATALAFNIGIALFGSTAPYVSTWLVSTTHSPIAPGVYLLIAALAGLLSAYFGLPRREGASDLAAARWPSARAASTR
jgi:MHS family proline/betaine transporter-like MFS transporter